MDLVDTLHDVRYWSENLFASIMTHLRDLQVKVMDFEIFFMFQVKVFWLKFLQVYISSTLRWILLILYMLLDIGLKIYSQPSWPNSLTFRSRSWTLKFSLCIRLKFLVKVFTSLYLLNFKMGLVDTLHLARYWSEILCYTLMTQLRDFQVKVIDLN